MTADQGPEIRPDDLAFVYLDVDNPIIAWLTYRGILNSPDIRTANPGNLSWFLVDTLKRGLASTIRREGALEGFRIKLFPNATSRLKCVYAYPTLEAAKEGDYGRGKFRKENLVAIAPANSDYKIGTYDSCWITNFDALPVDTAQKYWRGEKSKEPHFECLLSGRFLIFGTTVRKRAYDTVQRTWPNALAALELARLAVDFDSDFGSISPRLTQEGDRYLIRHVIRFDEKEGPEILKLAMERAKKDPKYHVNWADLEPFRLPPEDRVADERFKVPDTRAYDHELRIEKLEDMRKFVALVLTQQE